MPSPPVPPRGSSRSVPSAAHPERESVAPLVRARDAATRGAWSTALTEYATAALAAPLSGEDLSRYAVAAHLMGRTTESEELQARAHQQFLAERSPRRAARAAIWIAFHAQVRGAAAVASGWSARARRLLESEPADCVEQGYLHLLGGLTAFYQGDPVGAHAAFSAAAAIGERGTDADLLAIGRHGQGRSLIRMGEGSRGVALLDEAMVAVTAREVSPDVAGDIYCSVLEACREIFDIRRSLEWTTALVTWCAGQSDQVPYRGQCLLHRAELLQFQGDWSAARIEAQAAHTHLSDPPRPRSLGAACYRLAELARLSGEFADAERWYQRAADHGTRPEPGLALLRLAQGDAQGAASTVRRTLRETPDPPARPFVLAAAVDILLAAGALPEARTSAEELSQHAEQTGAIYLRATASQALGAVLLAEEKASEALAPLRQAAALWSELEAPYQTARTGLAVAAACAALGDTSSAALESAAARRILGRLGAATEPASLPAPPGAAAPPDGLTAREVEVLRRLATGDTNRAIAATLGISEKTVARHVSNIFLKLGLSTRAAATAYAYRNGLGNRPA